MKLLQTLKRTSFCLLASTGRNFCTKVTEKSSTQKKIIHVPRNTIDPLVQRISEIQKVLNKIKAISTQRKLIKSQLDTNRVDTQIDNMMRSVSSLLGYVGKASELPKEKGPRKTPKETSKTTS